MSVAIETQDLTKVLFSEVPVTLVDKVSLSVAQGEFVTITGPSGSGKSSLLYLLGLLDKPTSGEVFLGTYKASENTQEALADIRLKQIGFIFQFHFLLPEFTALENVMLPMEPLQQLNLKQREAKAAALLEQFGLVQHLHKYPRQLSGGQSQRVAIARALANDPSILLADEPTGNLDSLSSQKVQAIFKQIAHEQNKTVIVVTHDLSFAHTADRNIHMIDAKVVSTLGN